MKKLLLISLFASVLFANDSLGEPVTLRVGAGPLIATDGFGGSLRFWIRDALGFSVQMNKSWDMEMGGGELQLHYKFNTQTLFKPYLLAGGGFQLFDLNDITPAVENEPLGSFTAGAGVEALLGTSKQHGLSLEAAYNSAKLEYYGTAATEIGEVTQSSEVKEKSVQPFSATLLYHFYFVPAVSRDSDGDGIANRDDLCKKEAEDRDGFKDSDGCPDYDNDADAVPDSLDKCRDNPEDRDSFQDDDGCPEYDNDKDGIADSSDSCPDEKETVNSFEDLDGCPDSKPAEKEEVIEVVVKKEIEQIPVQYINFKLGSSELTDSSLIVVDTLVGFMKRWPSVKIEIQGHTDNSGEASYNQFISQQRADAVAEALVKRGVESERLQPVGYGQEKPLVSNDTREGRIKNRRVQIVIIE